MRLNDEKVPAMQRSLGRHSRQQVYSEHIASAKALQKVQVWQAPEWQEGYCNEGAGAWKGMRAEF